MPSYTTTVDILRHGRTTADDILRGRVDTPLSSEGFQQMKKSLAQFTANDKSPSWQQIVTSPLQRCTTFADHVNAELGTPVKADKGFIEMDYGDWDGETFANIRASDGELFSNVWRAPHQYSPPNGETYQEFYQRIGSAWDQLLQQYQGKHVLLICHSGVIKSLLGAILHAPLSTHSRIEVPYACISRVRIQKLEDNVDWPQLVFHNIH